MKEPIITLTDDEVGIERGILASSDTIVYLAAGASGMYYNKDGKRTFVFVTLTEFPNSPELRPFVFDTRAEIERFLCDLPRLRGE